MTKRLLLFPLFFCLALLIAHGMALPPAPQTALPKTGVALANLNATVAEIARAPHVVGSAEHDRVRDYVIARFKALGLKVEMQRDFGVRQVKRYADYIATSPVENIIAVLPGRDPAKPAVALLAHYDGVPFAPAAGDDAAGAASAIEAARLLTSGAKPARDVVFVMTDAEELGLIGAQSFFDGHPLAKHIGAVVNVEARGSKGRAFMFQTSGGNAALVELWAKSAISPSGNSLTADVYRTLPNDTDMTVSLDAGKLGINAAFGDGQFDYHAPSDSVANLDKGTLQHLAQFAFTTTQALAMADALPATSGDSAYFDVFGYSVIRYPVALGWLLTGVAILGLFLVRRRDPSARWRRDIAGAFGVAALTIAGAVVCHYLAIWMYGPGAIAGRERLAEGPTAYWFYLMLCIGLVLVAAPKSGLRGGANYLMGLVALLTQIYFPGANWLFVWPLIGAVLLSALSLRFAKNPVAQIVIAAAGMIIFALAYQTISFAFVMVGALTAGVVALVIPFTVLMFGPMLADWSVGRAGRIGGGGLIAVGLVGLAWLWQTDGFSARYQRPGDLFHMTDADTGKTYWATLSTADELPAGKAESIRVSTLRRSELWRVPAPSAPTPRPAIVLSEAGADKTITIDVPEAPRLFMLHLMPDRALEGVRLNGKPVRIDPKKGASLLYRAQAPTQLTLAFKASGVGGLKLEYFYGVDGLPPGAPQPKGPATNWTLLSHGRVVVGTQKLVWK
jgi:Peptidase family M28